eukprot:8621677-Pyramimonas_sp.AAC.1
MDSTRFQGWHLVGILFLPLSLDPVFLHLSDHPPAHEIREGFIGSRILSRVLWGSRLPKKWQQANRAQQHIEQYRRLWRHAEE